MTHAVRARLPLFSRRHLVATRLHASAVAVFLLGVGAATPRARAAEEILFIGNSFTMGYPGNISIPAAFDALARAGGHGDPVVVMRGVGGSHFEFHAGDPTTQAEISSRQWTHVFLQNYSTEPTHIGSVADHLNYGSQLYEQVMANNAQSRVVLLETWSRADAHPLISGISTSTTFASTGQMQGELRDNYGALAAALNAANPGNPPVVVAPVGDAWENGGGLLPASDPGFTDLHSDDDYHGDDDGYYLAAAVCYGTVYGVSPVGLHETPEVAALGLEFSGDPRFLEQVAWGTVRHATGGGPTLLFDFGSDRAMTFTGAAPGDPVNAWNNVTDDEGSVDGSEVPNLVRVDGGPTPIKLTITRRFNRASLDGTTSSTWYPVNASSDSLYGNTETYRGVGNVFPSFRFSGLEPAAGYGLTFYASQVGVSDSRETVYTVTGAGTAAVTLDASNNIDTETGTGPVYPNSDGEIEVSLAPGARNTSTYHFTDLGAVKLQNLGAASLAFAVQPSDQTVVENGQASFVCAAAGNPPYSFQWFQDGEAIDRATASRLTIPAAGIELDGASYTVTVTDADSQVTSDPAVLSILPDVVAPTFEVATLPGAEQLELVFSEALDPAGVLDPAAYRIANRGRLVPVLGVSLSPDGTVVTLTLGDTLAGNFGLVVPAGLSDLAGNPVDAGQLPAFGVAPIPSGIDVRIDFGAAATATGSADDPVNAWNNVTETIGRSDNGVLADLVGSDGAATGVRLEMIDRFNGLNGSGSTSSPGLPASVSQDSLYGNTETWEGLAGVFPALRLRGLDPGQAYGISFFASRINAGGDNRETRYTVIGAETDVALLDASENVAVLAVLGDLRPDAAGDLTVRIDPGPNNDNAYHFTYLGALMLSSGDAVGEDLLMFPPVPIDGRLFLDWIGEGSLEYSGDLAAPWTPVLPAPEAPYVEPFDQDGRRFYRLRSAAP